MAKNLIEKALPLFEQETDIQEMVKAASIILEFVVEKAKAAQKNLQSKADEFQTIIEKIKS